MFTQDLRHFGLGQSGEERLAGARAVDRDANARRGERTHHLAALDLRQEHRLAAALSSMRPRMRGRAISSKSRAFAKALPTMKA